MFCAKRGVPKRSGLGRCRAASSMQRYCCCTGRHITTGSWPLDHSHKIANSFPGESLRTRSLETDSHHAVVLERRIGELSQAKISMVRHGSCSCSEIEKAALGLLWRERRGVDCEHCSYTGYTLTMDVRVIISSQSIRHQWYD
ncbi:hypothetical protein KCU65_g403, partial [Aureobasidium melanogenum]